MKTQQIYSTENKLEALAVLASRGSVDLHHSISLTMLFLFLPPL